MLGDILFAWRGSAHRLTAGRARSCSSSLQLCQGEESVIESRYAALHVLEDRLWRAASVREWFPDPATDITLKQLKWLVGEGTSRGIESRVLVHIGPDNTQQMILVRLEEPKGGQ
jgi:hypothetical protein